MENIIYALVGIFIVGFIFYLLWFFIIRKKKNQTLKSKISLPKKNLLKINFENNEKRNLKNKELNNEFSILFEKIKQFKDDEKFNQLLNWSKEKDISIIQAFTLYEIKDINSQYSFSIEWFVYILFIFTLWEHRNKKIFYVENDKYKLKGEFVFFKYDHDDDKSTPRVYILYYFWENDIIFCGCFKQENILQLITYVTKQIVMSEAEIKNNDFNALQSQIIKILNDIYKQREQFFSQFRTNTNYKNNQYSNNDYNNQQNTNASNSFNSYLNENYYEILEINENADINEIKKGYRNQAKKYHPDVYKGNDANQKMIKINKAYEVLSDSNLKQQYDQMRKH